MNQKNENENQSGPYIPNILHKSKAEFYFHHVDPNSNIQSETKVLPNGIYERRFKDGVLIESISKIKGADGGWVETIFNPQGERTALGNYQRNGVPTQIIHFKNDKPFETTTFVTDEETGILVSKTTNEKDEIIVATEYDKNYQPVYRVFFEDNKPYQTEETRMHPEGVKVVKHESLKTNEMMFETFNQEGECIAEYHYKNKELVKSFDVEIDKERNIRFLRIWNKEDPSLVIKNAYRNGVCLGRYIYKNEKYVGFIECIYDSTPNRYEVLFDPNGNKISCTTYNEKNELIEQGFYENNIYRITTQRHPSNGGNGGNSGPNQRGS